MYWLVEWEETFCRGLGASAADCLRREMFIRSQTEASGKIAERGCKFKGLGSFTFGLEFTFPHGVETRAAHCILISGDWTCDLWVKS